MVFVSFYNRWYRWDGLYHPILGKEENWDPEKLEGLFLVMQLVHRNAWTWSLVTLTPNESSLYVMRAGPPLAGVWGQFSPQTPSRLPSPFRASSESCAERGTSLNRAFGPDIASPSSPFCHAHGSRSERDTKSPTDVETNCILIFL